MQLLQAPQLGWTKPSQIGFHFPRIKTYNMVETTTLFFFDQPLFKQKISKKHHHCGKGDLKQQMLHVGKTYLSFVRSLSQLSIYTYSIFQSHAASGLQFAYMIALCLGQ